MAFIVVNTRADHPKYEDGDILDVRQDKHIKMCHAEHVCHRKNFDNNVQGMNVPGTLAEKYYQRTHQYKFERVGDEVRRTDLWNGGSVMISNTPTLIDGKMQSMNVSEYLQRRLKHPNHKIFGSVNNEVWYGGKVRHDDLDTLWTDIEAVTPHRKADLDYWPYSDLEKKHYLALPVQDFSDKEIERMTEPLYAVDENTGEFLLQENSEERVVEKHRRMKYNWRAHIATHGFTEEQANDRSVLLDLRGRTKINPTINRERKKNAKERKDARQ